MGFEYSYDPDKMAKEILDDVSMNYKPWNGYKKYLHPCRIVYKTLIDTPIPLYFMNYEMKVPGMFGLPEIDLEWEFAEMKDEKPQTYLMKWRGVEKFKLLKPSIAKIIMKRTNAVLIPINHLE